MAGQIRTMIDKIINERSDGNPTVANCIKVKLILKGINCDSYKSSSPDDPKVIDLIKKAAIELNVKL